MIDDPEVTIEPADNGYVVRHYQRSTKKEEGGRTIRRVASTAEEALSHAGQVLGAKISKKKTSRRSDGAPAQGALSEHAMPASPPSRGHARRRRPRVSGRR